MTFSLLETIGILLVSFSLGFILGVVMRPFFKMKDGVLDLKAFIGIMVMFLLTLSVGAEILIPTYKTSSFLYALCGIVLGGYYGSTDAVSATIKNFIEKKTNTKL
jgi:hypothetical protein